MCARDQNSIFSTGGKFRPDYELLLELHALTLVTGEKGRRGRGRSRGREGGEKGRGGEGEKGRRGKRRSRGREGEKGEGGRGEGEKWGGGDEAVYSLDIK